MLRRTADDDDPYERPIVANADQLVIVTALADPPPRTGMIDRILVAGFDAGLAPLLCLTKADLASPTTCWPSTGRWTSPSRSPAGRRPDRAAQDPGRTSQRVRRPLRRGQVDPGQRADPRRDAGHRRGERGDRPRSAHLLLGDRAAAARRPGDRRRPGWVIDTPGVRSFGLSHVDPATDRGRVRRPGGDRRRLPARAAPTPPPSPSARSTTAVAAANWPPTRLESFRRMLGRASSVRSMSGPAFPCVVADRSGVPQPDRRPAAGAPARRRRRLDHHEPVQGARSARRRQARPDPGLRRRHRGRGGAAAHARPGPAAGRRARRGDGRTPAGVRGAG